MDCEKCEPLLLDELYEELDELTSASVRRHVSGCARCGSILGGLRATRRLASLPLVDPPPDLEARILEAAGEAQKVIPIRSKVSRVVSWAGAWAMQPQTAMAALFLLMVGSTTLFLQNRHSNSGSVVTVTERGEPGAKALETDRPDLATGAKAHGTEVARARGFVAPPPPAATTAAASSMVALAETAADDLAGGDREKKPQDRLKKEDENRAAASTKSLALLDSEEPRPSSPLNAGPYAGAPMTAPPRAAPTATVAAPGGGYAQAQAAQGRRDGKDGSDDFTRGMAAYRTSNYTEATRLFDAAAQTGDKNAALWGGKSVKAQSGCAAAVGRFDAIASTTTYPQQEAMIEAAECYRAVGNYDAARPRYQRLVPIATFAARAQAALDSMSQVAAKRAAAPAPPKAAAAEAPRDLDKAPPATATPQAPAQSTPKEPAASGL